MSATAPLEGSHQPICPSRCTNRDERLSLQRPCASATSSKPRRERRSHARATPYSNCAARAPGIPCSISRA